MEYNKDTHNGNVQHVVEKSDYSKLKKSQKWSNNSNDNFFL